LTSLLAIFTLSINDYFFAFLQKAYHWKITEKQNKLDETIIKISWQNLEDCVTSQSFELHLKLYTKQVNESTRFKLTEYWTMEAVAKTPKNISSVFFINPIQVGNWSFQRRSYPLN